MASSDISVETVLHGNLVDYDMSKLLNVLARSPQYDDVVHVRYGHLAIAPDSITGVANSCF